MSESDAKKPPKTLNRRFIIVEGLYLSTGMISPLPQIVELANKYKFRCDCERACDHKYKFVNANVSINTSSGVFVNVHVCIKYKFRSV